MKNGWTPAGPRESIRLRLEDSPIAIERNPGDCSRRDYDLIIVGGGIYGAMLALQATARNLRPLLVERDDFGGHTSFNSLRIVHGGLRYLQSFDLKRFFESVRERKWFLSEFPEFVRPLPCLMPLYGQGLKRLSVMRVALGVNDAFSYNRNRDVPDKNQLPKGRIVGRDEARDLFPLVDDRGLQGAALWYDAELADSPRVLVELLHWAAGNGADFLNYTEATGLESDHGRISGLLAVDRVSGEEHLFRAPVVVNATGPWSDQTAAVLGAKSGDSFRPSLAWNIWMDQEALSQCALALTAKRRGSQTYFLHPWKGRLLIGTGHSSWNGSLEDPRPSHSQVQTMLDDINAAVPGLELKPEGIRRLFSGLLPARKAGTAELSARPYVHEHRGHDSPKGLYSVYGVKFTTSRHVAKITMERIFGKPLEPDRELPRPASRNDWSLSDDRFSDKAASEAALFRLRQLIADESVVHLSDLVLRRTDLWEHPATLRLLCPSICKLFAWDEARRKFELDSLERELGRPEELASAI